jgi:hypothetical protein
VAEELPEIGFQTLQLYGFLQSGMVASLVYAFAAILSVNCLVRCYRLVARAPYHERNDSLVNSLFQFFFAVLFPAALLLYAVTAFSMDRESYALRQQHFAIGAFERLARFAQPNEYLATTTILPPLLNALLLRDHVGFALASCGLHFAFLWRVHDVVVGSTEGFIHRRLPAPQVPSSRGS